MPEAKAKRQPLPRPIVWMMIAATGLFVTPLIWVIGLPVEAGLVWAFLWFDVILVAAIALFWRRKRVLKAVPAMQPDSATKE